MLAHHPITGQPIRILRTEPSISCDQKTLVWIGADFVPSHRWSRWYPVVSTPEAVAVCGAEYVNAVIIDSFADLDAWLPLLPTIFHASSDALLFVPSCVADTLRKRGFETDSTLLWEDLYDMYPYLGEPIAIDDPVFKVVVSAAHILRMDRIATSVDCSRDSMAFGVRAQVDAWKASMNGTFLQLQEKADDGVIPRTWLIQQYYMPTNNRRSKEINACLNENIACAYIDNILLLNEQLYDLPKSEKITQHVIGHRLTYSDVLNAAIKHVPKGDYVLFSNSDIYFNTTLKYLWRISMKESRYFLALLRWEAGSGEPTIFGPRSDSQDSWILARDCLDFAVSEDEFGFPFGKSGCDNAITLLMLRKKFSVVNPAYTIRTIHVHSSGIRTYDPKDILYKTHYLYVDPTPIHPFTVMKNLSGIGSVPESVAERWKARTLGASFTRPVLSVADDTAKTVCTMLKHNGVAEYVAGEANLWTPPPNNGTLYNFRGGAFVTCDGRVSNFRSIFVGPHNSWQRGWESATQNTLTNSIHVPHMVAVPCDERASRSLSAWALYYLPRVLGLRKIITDAGLLAPEFLVPQINNIGSFLNDCVWSTSNDRGNITITPILPDIQYYSEDVWAIAQESEHGRVTAEDIAVLRSLLPQTERETSGPVAVFCVEDDDSALCTRFWAESVVENVLPKGWTVYYVGADDNADKRRRAFQEANWIIGSGDSLDWMWLARPGATVMDFNREWDPRDDHIHLAGACGLQYVLGTYKREPIQIQRQNAMVDIGRAIRKFGFDLLLKSVTADSEKPVIVLPTGAGLSGIHAHCGDTFREMAELWGERGYVKLQRREDTPYCWWGGLGQIVLYDRPTARWWNPDLNYQMALFGNCAPPGPGAHVLKQSVWGFWPRSPRAIESVAERKLNLRGFKDRTINSLFLGKIENGVQHAARTGADWSKCVELFSMPIDSTGQAYPYTQTQYLEKLCSARFGLCLSGFGPKCNREIEYFACGVVPIVTPGVDMKGYLVPPKEGVHYLRVEKPEDVPKVISSISPDKWAAMSLAGRAWWRTFASAEGLYRLTFSRIEQARPYFAVGIPKQFTYSA